jgi:endonuclease YncB( thermonuclease family)
MSNQKRSKLPFGCLIVAGIVATVCGTTVSMCALSGVLAPAPVPTLDTNAIATAAFQTALAMNLQTQAASNPTLEPTYTSLPTATHTQAPLPTATDAIIPVTGASCIPGSPPQTGKVVDVVDGDTIKVLLDADGATYSVRYIGMDTPENTGQIEYFGPEATAKNSELVYGKTVTLVKDVSETDQFGRLLRYVIADGLFVNYELVAQGYANTASYPPDIACIPTFQAVEQQASAFKLGLWGMPPTQIIILPLPTAPSGGSGSSGANAPCNCSGPDLDCKDFKTHAAAQACYDHCVALGYGNIFRLDGNDNDGLACENLP